MHIIHNLAEEPLVCIVISTLLFLAGHLAIYLLLEALLKMHRSRSAVKKLMKQYSFRQKLWLVPFLSECLHAPGFCKLLVRFQRTRVFCLGLYLLAALLFGFGFVPNVLIAWLTAGIFLCFDLPLFLIQVSLSRPIIGRFKEFSFQKYHNTSDHSSLF